MWWSPELGSGGARRWGRDGRQRRACGRVVARASAPVPGHGLGGGQRRLVRDPARRPGRAVGVVMIAASLGAWCFAYSSARLITQTAWYLPTLGVIALGFTGLLALTKLALAGTSPLGQRVLWALGGAIMTGATSGALTPLLVSRPDLTDNQFSVPLTSLGVVV